MGLGKLRADSVLELEHKRTYKFCSIHCLQLYKKLTIPALATIVACCVRKVGKMMWQKDLSFYVLIKNLF